MVQIDGTGIEDVAYEITVNQLDQIQIRFDGVNDRLEPQILQVCFTKFGFESPDGLACTNTFTLLNCDNYESPSLSDQALVVPN